MSDSITRLSTLAPPLRIIITNRCNGNCWFCHNEGQIGSLTISESMLIEIVESVKLLGIKQICITGGEPTFDKSLLQKLKLVAEFRANAKTPFIVLITNGFNLSEMIDGIVELVDKISISLHNISFDNNRYSLVNSRKLLNLLNKKGLGRRINLNVIIREDIDVDVEEILRIAYDNDYSVTFSLPLTKENYSLSKTPNFKRLLTTHLHLCKLAISHSPFLVSEESNNPKIIFRLKQLNRLISWKICEGCINEKCNGERICGIRVYPNGVCSPCLFDQKRVFGETIYEKIDRSYNMLLGNYENWKSLLNPLLIDDDYIKEGGYKTAFTSEYLIKQLNESELKVLERLVGVAQTSAAPSQSFHSSNR